jgi:two-component system, NtrC family, sensor histidine kinase HydH
MNRKILLQVTGPALILGALLLSTCVVSAWYINRLQANLSHVLDRSVASLEAAQDLEIRARQLRYHTFLQLIDPQHDRSQSIRDDHGRFEASLSKAAEVANTTEENDCIQRIRTAYDGYGKALAQFQKEMQKEVREADRPPNIGPNIGRFADAHPIKEVVNPCEDLLKISNDELASRSAESSRLSQQARLAMLLLGVSGPVGGVIVGFAAARGLNRSIYQLSVRVRSVAQRLNQDVGSVDIAAEGNIQQLDAQLQHVLRRVEEVMDRLQQQHVDMLRAEQLAAVGQLGASVAHEVRNPLMGIKLLVDAALRPGNGRALTGEDLQVIRGEIGRMEQTVQGLLDFARLPRPERTTFDLCEAIRQAVDLIRARARQQRVEVHLTGDEPPAWVSMDRGQLHTVLVNLLLNALDAMPSGGLLSVIVDDAGNGRARITITDTGTGIPEEIMGRLFTPFASHKPTGTGLGLSISRRIIEEHQGSITASNRQQGGACFSITLPTCSAEPRPLLLR